MKRTRKLARRDPFKWPSTPIINVWWQANEAPFDDSTLSRLRDEQTAMHMMCRPPVASLKERLGKHNFTWMGECRYWVWEGADWRVFAGTTGVSFEVRYGLNKKQALNAWHDFLSRLGITSTDVHCVKTTMRQSAQHRAF